MPALHSSCCIPVGSGCTCRTDLSILIGWGTAIAALIIHSRAMSDSRDLFSEYPPPISEWFPGKTTPVRKFCYQGDPSPLWLSALSQRTRSKSARFSSRARACFPYCTLSLSARSKNRSCPHSKWAVRPLPLTVGADLKLENNRSNSDPYRRAGRNNENPQPEGKRAHTPWGTRARQEQNS